MREPKIIRAEDVFLRVSAISAKDLLYEIPAKPMQKPLINGLSCEIDKKGITAIMGANGAGKSLLLRLFAGLIQPQEGQLKWFGGKRFAKGDISIVFQKPTLLRRTVKANLEHALYTLNIPKNKRPQKLEELIHLGQLEDIIDRPARVLSGGEQQRLSMMRALVGDPKILLLDEPTASLDPHSTAMFEELIDNAAQKNIKLILVTHDTGQAKRVASDIMFLHKGVLSEHTTAADFFVQPRTEQAKAYLDGRLLLDD